MGWTAVGTIGSTATGGGGSGSPGQRGADGTKVLVGSAAPSILQGNVGDLYFQTPPPGATGPILIPGPQGPPGQRGRDGISGTNVGSDGGLFTPVAGNWVFTSNNSATGSTKNSALEIFAPAGNNDLYSYFTKKTLPTPPYSATFYLTAPIHPQTNFSSYGVMWFNSSNTFLKAFGFVYSSSAGGLLMEVGYATDGIAHIATDNKLIQMWGINQVRWMRLRDDNVNQYYDFSVDGINWINAYSEARNTNVTPDSLGIYLNVRNATYFSSVSLLSYAENANGSL